MPSQRVEIPNRDDQSNRGCDSHGSFECSLADPFVLAQQDQRQDREQDNKPDGEIANWSKHSCDCCIHVHLCPSGRKFQCYRQAPYLKALLFVFADPRIVGLLSFFLGVAIALRAVLFWISQHGISQ